MADEICCICKKINKLVDLNTRIPDIAVLLTCHNRRDKTIQCLRNLYSQAGIGETFIAKVFLVDDGSTDGTAEEVKKCFREVNIIPGNGSLYWNRGMYKAWQTAKGAADFDYYLWLNDDTDLLPGALVEILDCAKIKDDNAIICGAIRSRKTNLFTYGGHTKDGKEVLPDNQMRSCFVINGNCVLVSRAICNAIGMLNPVYPHAIGDHEYGLRARKRNVEVVTTRIFVGYCERNNYAPPWFNSKLPLKKRFKALYSPLCYCHPYYFFLFEKKYYGLITAVKHFFTIHLRVLLPSLWHFKTKMRS